MSQTKRPDSFKVLVNYKIDGVSVSRSLYTGPHQKYADQAYEQACVLGRHGILTNCTVRFYDGFRLRLDKDKAFGDVA